MLSIDPDKVCFVILRARELEEEDLIDAQGQDDVEERSINIAHEEAFGELEVGHDAETDPIQEELYGFISGLSVDEQVELVALTWIGRGDYEADDWEEAVESAVERNNGRTADYLVNMSRVSDYLEEGLNAFGHSFTDFDEARE